MPEENNIRDIILFSIDKLSRLNRHLSWEAAKKEGLSLMQLQIIDHISRTPRQSATVSSIAGEFGLTKATISESANNLAEKGYLEKNTDSNDKRIVYLSLSQHAENLIGSLLNKDRILNDVLLKIPDLGNMKVADFFPVYLKHLIDDNIIQRVRMCIDCSNFNENAKPGSVTPHLCRFTNKYFSNVQMNTDCADFLKADGKKTKVVS